MSARWLEKLVEDAAVAWSTWAAIRPWLPRANSMKRRLQSGISMTSAHDQARVARRFASKYVQAAL